MSSTRPDPELERIGRQIRRARQIAGLTQAEVRDQLGLGYATVSQWECGRQPPTLRNFLALVRLLGPPLLELLGLDGLASAGHMDERPVAGLGETIRAARMRAGMSQQKLADQLRVKQSTVSQWERGAIRPTSENLRRLRGLLNL